MRRFWKYSGLGNDFILFDAMDEAIGMSGQRARALCERRFGVGADGVLVVEPSAVADARMTVINADGSEAQMCGNGLRAVARFLDEVKGLGGREMAVETAAGLRQCRVNWSGHRCEVSALMGQPRLKPREIPMRIESTGCLAPGGDRFVAGELVVGETRLTATAVSMGNPHLVCFDLDADRFADLAPSLERHAAFPERVNVECAKATGENRFEVVVWERGCGFTQACGTGACAVAVAAILEGRARLGAEIEVRLPGGELFIRVDGATGKGKPGAASAVEAGEVAAEKSPSGPASVEAVSVGQATMRGEVSRVFEGMIDLALPCFGL